MASVEGQANYFCEQCGDYTSVIEDHRLGDQICSNCGTIVQERVISSQQEARIFSDDPSSKMKGRTGALYNPFMEHSLTEQSKLEREEKQFLWDGLKNIDDLCFKLYNGDLANTGAQQRAKELFQKAFHKQVEQKQGKVAMKRTGVKNHSQQNRIKFSKRKQYVVTCLYQALKEFNITTWSIADLSEKMDGIEVSDYSAQKALKELEIPDTEKVKS